MKNLIKVLGLIIPLTITGCKVEEMPQRKVVYNPHTNKIEIYEKQRTPPILGIFSSTGYIKTEEREAPENYRKELLNSHLDLASK